MLFNEMIMDSDLQNAAAGSLVELPYTEDPTTTTEELENLHRAFNTRLVAANLRTEAVRAGMVDLDGLKLIDLSDVRLDGDDKIVGGRKLMDELRRSKPWLFGGTSSSSASVAPVSLPVRPRTAMEMTDDEYVAARAVVTKYQF